MLLTLTSTSPKISVARWYWPTVGTAITIDTSILNQSERPLVEYAINRGDLVSNVRIINNSLRATEEDVSEDETGGEVRTYVNNLGKTVLTGPEGDISVASLNGFDTAVSSIVQAQPTDVSKTVTETTGTRQVAETTVFVQPTAPSTLQQHSYSIRTRYEGVQPMPSGGWIVSYKGENQVVSTQPVDKSVVYVAYTAVAGGSVLDKALGFEAVIAGLDNVSLINQYAAFYSANLEAVPGVDRINVAYAFANDWWRAYIKNVGVYWKAQDRVGGSILKEVAPSESPGVVAGRYYGPWGATTYTPIALAEGFIYACPFFVPERTTFTKIGCRVVTAAAGSNVRLGLYYAEDGQPSTRLVDSGQLSAATAGPVEANINVTLESGMYFFAAASSSAAVAINGSMVPNLKTIMGSTSDNGNETTPLMAQAFGSMPAVFTTGGYFDTASAVPYVWMRK